MHAAVLQIALYYTRDFTQIFAPVKPRGDPIAIVPAQTHADTDEGMGSARSAVSIPGVACVDERCYCELPDPTVLDR